MSPDAILDLARTQLVQLTLVILAIAAITTLLCRRRPHLAYALWLVALVKCFVPPVWESPTGVFSWANAERQAAVMTAAPPIAGERRSMHAPPTLAEPVAAPPIAPIARMVTAAPVREPLPWLLIVWGAGTLVMLIVPLWQAAFLRHLVLRTAQPPSPELRSLLDQVATSLGLSRAVPLVVTDLSVGPALLGVVGSLVVLPRVVLDQPVSTIRTILAHELVHLRRRDPLVAVAQWLATAAWWFHPLVWWMNREINRSREQSCDEEVIAALRCEPAGYAQMLVDVLRLRRTVRPAPFLLGVSTMHVTTKRLGHIMGDARMFHPRTPRACWAIVLIAALLALPGAGVALEDRVDIKPQPTTGPATAATTQPAEPMTFEGSVVDKTTGKPIEGAKVTVHYLGKRKGNQYKNVAPSTEHPTDAQGTFTFTLPAALAAQNPYLEMEVHHPDYASVAGTGYGLSLIRRDLELGQRPWFSRIELFPGEEVTGVIQSPDGKPLAGVEVGYSSVAGPYEMRFVSRDRVDDIVKTDAQGRFRFNAIKGATINDVFARSETYPDVYISVGDRRGDIGMFRFQDGVVVTGTALDAAGKPLPNLRLELRQQRGAAARSYISYRHAVSDAQGRFTFPPVQPDPYVLRVRQSHDAEIPPVPAAFLPKEITVAAGQQQPIEYRAVPHVTIRLQYVDSAGNPTRGHGVYLFAPNGGRMPFGAEGPIDEQGRIEMVVPKGLTDVEISLRTDPFSVLRYRRGANGPLRAGSRIELDSVDEDMTNLFIVRYEAPIVVVRAVDPAGEPVPNVRPQIVYPQGTVPKMKGEWISGLKGDVAFEKQEDGAWRTSHLLPDQEFTLSVHAPGTEPFEQQLKLPEGEVREITVSLKPAAPGATTGPATKSQ